MRITLNYERYLKDFLATHPGFLELPYDTQYQELVGDGFGWANFLTLNFEEFGWSVWEPVTNFAAHQKRWARDNGVSYGEKNWFLEITAAQVKHFRPDVLFVDSFTAFHPDFLSTLRQSCPSLRLVLGWCGAPYRDPNIFKGFDITLSNIPSLVAELETLGRRAFFLPHSFETRLLSKLRPDAASLQDFTFTGSVTEGGESHAVRARLLAALARTSGLKIYADLPPETSLGDFVDLARQKKLRKSLALFAEMPMRRTLHKASRPPVFGLAMYQLLADSRVTFNNHIGLSEAHASNTRIFQATGCGACLLTDWKPDLHQYFEADKEVVTYRNAAEARDKVKYLLAHESVRKTIAEAGRKRTLRDHTFRQRCEILHDLITGIL